MTSWGSPYEKLTKECNSPVLKLYLFNGSKENGIKVKEQFEHLKEVENAELIEFSYLRENLIIKNQKIDDFFDLVVYNHKLHDSIRVIDGDNNLKENECLIPAVLANKENIKIGDTIKIGNELSYIVKGIYTDPYNMSISFDIEIIVNDIPKELGSKYYISVFTDKNITGSDLIDAYRENNNKILEGRGITLEDRISNNQMTEQVLGGILLAMSVIILLVSGIMIQYMIKNTLISERKSIAIYKTMGYKNRNIVGIYMKFYLFLVLIGSVAGAICSKIISDSFTRGTFENLGVTSSSGILSSGILCVVVILLYVLLQVYLVLNKTKKIKPIEVFRGEQKSKITRKTKKRDAKSRITNFSPLAMAVRMIGREKKNTIIIIITCIMSAYCVNFAATTFTLLSGMADNNYYWIGFDKHDVSMESINLNQYDPMVAKLRSLDEVERVIPITTEVAASVGWEKGIGDAVITTMIYETYKDIDMPILEGRNPLYSDEIAIGNAVAEKLNKHVGDYIDIYFNGNKKVTLLLCGTYQGFYDMGKSCRLLGATLKEHQIDFQYTEGSIYLKEGYAANDFVEKYSETFKHEAKLMNRLHKYENIMNMITGPQIMAIKPFMILAIILGGLNIIAIVYLKNKDYSKIHSIYKAMGYPANHLLKANMYYILIIASTSIIVTVPLFMLVFPRTMVLSMSLFGFKEYIVTYNAMILFTSNICALVIYLISGLLSSKSLYDNPITDLTCE
jgi:putative ABC transport system permease protein